MARWSDWTAALRYCVIVGHYYCSGPSQNCSELLCAIQVIIGLFTDIGPMNPCIPNLCITYQAISISISVKNSFPVVFNRI